MLDFLRSWGLETWSTVREAAPWLLAGFLLAGAVHALLPLAMVRRHLGDAGWAGVLKASLIGIPLPLCSCSVIPVAASLRRNGASKGAFTSFLISTPETGLDSIAVSYILLGPVLAVVRPVAALVTSLFAGGIIDSLLAPSPAGPETTCSGASCECDNSRNKEPGRNLQSRLSDALRFGLLDLLGDLSLWLAAGFVLAGLISAVVPAGALGSYGGPGLAPMLLMLAVGLPLYVCATSSTPVAAALIGAGLSPGAALVFLLVGPATNVTTMLLVARDLGKAGLVLYLGTIGTVAVLFGLMVDHLLPFDWTMRGTTAGPCAWEESALGSTAAVALMLLAGLGLIRRYRRRSADSAAGAIRKGALSSQ